MRRVYKYPIPIAGNLDLTLPLGAKPLHIEEQNGTVCLWALVDPSAMPTVRKFCMRGTGHPIENDDADLDHVGTFTVRERFVFHLFEVLP